MFNSIISDTSAAIKLIAALYEAGVIDTRTYHSVLTKYAPASWAYQVICKRDEQNRQKEQPANRQMGNKRV